MKLRHGWPLVLLAVLLVAVPILEVWLLVQVGQNLGLAFDSVNTELVNAPAQQVQPSN